MEWLQGAALVIGVAALVGVIWAVVRFKGLEASLSLMTVTNHELREMVEWERADREQAETKYRIEVAELRGQVQFLQSDMMRGLVDTLKTALKDAVYEVLNAPDRRT